jgi:hypothetical protein
LFRSEFFFRTTRELEYLFFLSRKARIFFPEFNIGLYDKHSESYYFFFLHQNQNIFVSNIGNQNIFFKKKTIPPWKLNGPSMIEGKRANNDLLYSNSRVVRNNNSERNKKSYPPSCKLNVRSLNQLLSSNFSLHAGSGGHRKLSNDYSCLHQQSMTLSYS